MTKRLITIGEHTFSFHELLKQNLDSLKNANKRDWDFKILISGDGMTRTGKTTLASQIALYLDPTINLDRVIFRGDKLITKSLEIGKCKAVIYDEAKEGLDSKKSMEGYSKKITDYFSECGWMNQYLIIVLPEFFDLNKTVALNQSICLINCYISGSFQRGNFGFYNRKDKRYLYIKGKKYNNYSCQKPTFNGTFTSYFPFNTENYEKLKIENQRSMRKDEENNKGVPNQRKTVQGFTNLVRKLKSHDWKISEIAKYAQVSDRTISRHLAKNQNTQQSDI